MHSLKFRIRRYIVMCTTRGHPYHSPKLHPGPRNSADTQTAVITIHFASPMTRAKCNNCTTPRTAPGINYSIHFVSIDLLRIRLSRTRRLCFVICLIIHPSPCHSFALGLKLKPIYLFQKPFTTQTTSIRTLEQPREQQPYF